MTAKDTDQARAIKALVEENGKLTEMRDKLHTKIKELHKYNDTINPQKVTEILESELRKIAGIKE